MNVEGIVWHGATPQQDQVEATKTFFAETMGLKAVIDSPALTMFAMPNGTMLEIAAPAAVPAYGYNGKVAFGFRVDDVETASTELEAAGIEFVSEIMRPQPGFSYRHFKGPDGAIYGINSVKAPN